MAEVSSFMYFIALVTLNYCQAMKRCDDRTNDNLLGINITQPMDFLAGKVQKVRRRGGGCGWHIIRLDGTDILC